MRLTSALTLALMAATLALPVAAQTSPPATEAVVEATGGLLRGLDKVTGHTTDFELAAGEVARFGRITITLGQCRYPAEDPASNSYGWITILDDLATAPVFQGWMIADSPALNALDHQRYDVWLIRCNIPEA